jgi:hypothetical protein
MKLRVILLAIFALMFLTLTVHAQGVGSAAPPDPGLDLVTFMTSGKYLAAVGAILTILAGLLRTGLGARWAWFKTIVGTYVVSWATVAIAYVGTALESGAGFSLAMIGVALATGFVASGVLSHIQDTGVVKQPITAAQMKAGITVAMIALIFSCSGPQVTAEKAAGTCELQSIEQVGKTNAVPIVTQIYDAITSGGAALPALLTSLVTEFGPGTISCASQLAAVLFESSSTAKAKTGEPLPGLIVLRAEMAKRGWSK